MRASTSRRTADNEEARSTLRGQRMPSRADMPSSSCQTFHATTSFCFSRRIHSVTRAIGRARPAFPPMPPHAMPPRHAIITRLPLAFQCHAPAADDCYGRLYFQRAAIAAAATVSEEYCHMPVFVTGRPASAVAAKHYYYRLLACQLNTPHIPIIRR